MTRSYDAIAPKPDLFLLPLYEFLSKEGCWTALCSIGETIRGVMLNKVAFVPESSDSAWLLVIFKGFF